MHQTQSIVTTLTRHALSAWRIHDKGPKNKTANGNHHRQEYLHSNQHRPTYKPTLWEEGGALLDARPP